METRSVYPIELEIRRRGGFSSFFGRFLYGSLATIRDRGVVRKETIQGGAFDFALDEGREIHLLSGHSYDKPLASRKGGTLELSSDADALTFRARLPDDANRPSWMDDTIKAMEAGLIGGVSPGFKIPPRSVVPDAFEDIDEPGNPGVKIRKIRHAVLYELSLVTRAAYPDTELDLRARATAEGAGEYVDFHRRALAWL